MKYKRKFRKKNFLRSYNARKHNYGMPYFWFVLKYGCFGADDFFYATFNIDLGLKRIVPILGDLLQSVFSVVSALDNIVQSKLVSVTKIVGF